MDDRSVLQSFYQRLEQRTAHTPVTFLLIAINVVIFIAMLLSGAGFWHSPNGVQLSWGANFAPATQDGEWWRLGTAMFLHFGVMHLVLNSLALWDIGQLAERMYGRSRYLLIYALSGLFGNLLSLVMQGNQAVSGGASGAIFGIYGAALVFLWRERANIAVHEFRWLFGGGLLFALLSIGMGFVVSGIDNSAHIGGLLSGMLLCIFLSKSLLARAMPRKYSLLAALCLVMMTVLLVIKLPQPKYRWSDELLLRSQINAFLYENQEINRQWLAVLHDGKQGNKTFEELASKIDFAILQPYESSHDKLTQLPSDPALPSAQQLEKLIRYTETRKQEFQTLVEELKRKQATMQPDTGTDPTTEQTKEAGQALEQRLDKKQTSEQAVEQAP